MPPSSGKLTNRIDNPKKACTTVNSLVNQIHCRVWPSSIMFLKRAIFKGKYLAAKKAMRHNIINPDEISLTHSSM